MHMCIGGEHCEPFSGTDWMIWTWESVIPDGYGS